MYINENPTTTFTDSILDPKLEFDITPILPSEATPTNLLSFDYPLSSTNLLNFPIAQNSLLQSLFASNDDFVAEKTLIYDKLSPYVKNILRSAIFRRDITRSCSGDRGNICSGEVKETYTLVRILGDKDCLTNPESESCNSDPTCIDYTPNNGVDDCPSDHVYGDPIDENDNSDGDGNSDYYPCSTTANDDKSLYGLFTDLSQVIDHLKGTNNNNPNLISINEGKVCNRMNLHYFKNKYASNGLKGFLVFKKISLDSDDDSDNPQFDLPGQFGGIGNNLGGGNNDDSPPTMYDLFVGYFPSIGTWFDSSSQRKFNLENFNFKLTDSDNNNNNNDEPNNPTCRTYQNSLGISIFDSNCIEFTCKDGNCVEPQNIHHSTPGQDISKSNPFLDFLTCKQKDDTIKQGYTHTKGNSDFLTFDETNGCSDIPLKCLVEHNGLLDGSNDCTLKGGFKPPNFPESAIYYYNCNDDCSLDYDKHICYASVDIATILTLAGHPKICKGRIDGEEFTLVSDSDGDTFKFDGTPIQFKCHNCQIYYKSVDLNIPDKPFSTSNYVNIPFLGYDEVDCPSNPSVIEQLELVRCQ